MLVDEASPLSDELLVQATMKSPKPSVATSGVFWDVRELSTPEMTDIVLTWNPLAFMLDGFRQILMHDNPPSMVHLGALFLVFSTLLAIMVVVMRRASQFLALKALTV